MELAQIRYKCQRDNESLQGRCAATMPRLFSLHLDRMDKSSVLLFSKSVRESIVVKGPIAKREVSSPPATS